MNIVASNCFEDSDPSMAAEIPSSKDPIPTYRIDLSLPPSERYVKMATEFASKMQKITPLFDQVLAPAIPRKWIRRWIATLAWLFLRRVYSAEETAEIKGIAKASGVDMYFLVALNVLLDSMLGCTSGAAMTTPKGSKRKKGAEKGENRMMHFRTLDWGMDPLRSVLVVLEFVRSESEEPDKVIGRTITYAGFVGVLTGVRDDLSISLNFRPNHECSTLKLRIHQLLILFGFRPSIAHILRSAIFPSPKRAPPPMAELAKNLSQEKAAPCYLILCDGTSATVLEKDLLDAKIRTSNDFIVHTNNDTSPNPAPEKPPQDPKEKDMSKILDNLGMDAFLKDSRERSACVQKKWDALKGRQRRKQQAESVEEKDMKAPSVREETLVRWVNKYPTMNGQSHFGCVMDPKKGNIRWIKRGACWLSVESLTGANEEDITTVSD